MGIHQPQAFQSYCRINSKTLEFSKALNFRYFQLNYYLMLSTLNLQEYLILRFFQFYSFIIFKNKILITC